MTEPNQRLARPPLLLQINANTWIRGLFDPAEGGSFATVPDSEIERLAALGVDRVWLMGVWTKGPVGRDKARRHPTLRDAYDRLLPDWTDTDVIGSPFAVQAYDVDPALGGDKALRSLRGRLRRAGLGLVLDYVPNHTAQDHPWVFHHPEFYVTGDPALVESDPDRFFLADTVRGPRAVAFGRDPYFPGWTDTAQLDVRNPAYRDAAARQLLRIADLCDGVRCDMAMLLLEDVFHRTWPELAPDDSAPRFWPTVIDAVRAAAPGFTFMAEVYWGLEGRLIEAGFDTVYDKALMDWLRNGDWAAVRHALGGPIAYRERCVVFVENHDETPARVAFGDNWRAATAFVALLPGLPLIHEGQLDGREERYPVQLGRVRPPGMSADDVAFLRRVLDVARDPGTKRGHFRCLTHDELAGPEHVLAYAWVETGGRARVLVANFGGEAARLRLRLPLLSVWGRRVTWRDRLSERRGEVAGGDLLDAGVGLSLDPAAVRILDLAVSA